MLTYTLRPAFVSRPVLPARQKHGRALRVRSSVGGLDGASSESLESSTEVFDRLSLAKRAMQLAVAEEQYERAAQLRDEIGQLYNRLPTSKQLMMVKIDVLEQGSLEQRRSAAEALGELGDADALPYLAACLADAQLVEACEAAMWQVFTRAPTPETSALMDSGCRAMQQPSQWGPAIMCFTDVIRQAPSYAEGYNKRATVLYLLQRYQDAIDDCKVVLDLNPYHFGAAAGMGMCYMKSGNIPEAIKAFELALRIHPQLTHLRDSLENMRRMLREGQELQDF